MKDWYFIAEQPAPAPHLAHPEGCAGLRIVLVTVPHVSRSCEHFLGGFELHLLPPLRDQHRCRANTGVPRPSENAHPPRTPLGPYAYA